MRIGDLVALPSGSTGVVRRLDSQVRTALVQIDMTSKLEEVPDDIDQTDASCRILCNPADVWPFVKVPDKPRFGPFVKPALGRRDGLHELEVFKDWVPTGIGGTISIFLNPALGVRYGHVIVAIYQKGRGRIDVPVNFGTVASMRVAKPQPEVQVSKDTAYDHLMGDE